ncbi:hypothetical protein [Streptomyces sp. NPDC091215]|uniref:hypothetical protein n=1 Tax=Streptomyces sp. NPDC091215 TaxID=3155192 RepID=UPI00341C6285
MTHAARPAPTTAAPETFLTALRTQTSEPPPATGIPTWLWRLATAVHGELPPPDADAWAARLHDLLRTAGAPAGLRAVHVWQANTVLPLLAETTDTAVAADPDRATDKTVSADLHRSADTTVAATLHRAAAQGTPVDRDTWRSALHPVLLCLHEAAYDRASAYAEGHAGARDYALANGYSAAEADAYGHAYARLSSGANARAFAETHAEALGPALATAYAADDCLAYADAYPGAQLRAVVRATAARDDAPTVRRLAEGLLTALTTPQP